MKCTLPRTRGSENYTPTFNLVLGNQHKVTQGMLNKLIDRLFGKEHYKIKIKVVFKDGETRGHYSICDRFYHEVYSTYITNPADETDYHFVLYSALQSLLFLKDYKTYRQYTKINAGALTRDAINVLKSLNIQTTFIIYG